MCALPPLPTAHPLLLGEEPLAPLERAQLLSGDASSPWTTDMDDMLRIIVVHAAFDFGVVSARLRQYVQRIRAVGGILPDRVQPDDYDARACRLRWAHLDYAACAEHARRGGARAAEAVAHNPLRDALAREAASAAPAAEPSRLAADSDGDDDEEEEDMDDDGVLDTAALRSRLLLGRAPLSTGDARPAAALSGSARGAEAQLEELASVSAAGGLPDAAELLQPLMQMRARVARMQTEGVDEGGRAAQLGELSAMMTTLSELTRKADAFDAARRSNGGAENGRAAAAAGAGGADADGGKPELTRKADAFDAARSSNGGAENGRAAAAAGAGGADADGGEPEDVLGVGALGMDDDDLDELICSLEQRL